jgi:hypothetical protein
MSFVMFVYVMVSNTSSLYDQPCGCHVRAPWFTPGFKRGPYCSLFQCTCVACVLLVFTLCVLCPMLSVSLDFPFLIAASGFSNVYVGGAYRNLLSYDIIRKANVLLHQA